MSDETKVKAPEKKPDITLSDGREIYMDLNAVTIKEWRAMFDKDQPEETGDEILGRVCHLTLDEIQALGALDFRRMSARMFEKFRTPLADPT